jgi:hypothetical protein
MSRFFAVLAVMAVSVIAVPTVSADLTDDLLQTALDDIAAWDPEFAALAPASPPGSGHDFVAGSHKVTFQSPTVSAFQHVRVSAHSGPAGENPKGSVRVSFDVPWFGGEGDVKGDVICLRVAPLLTGFEARVSALLQQPFNGDTHVTLVIRDLGNPGALMGQSPDQAFIDFNSVPPPPNCATTGTSLVGEQSGNFVIRDAP